MTQGTPWKANWLMFHHEVKVLFSSEWRSARVGHKFLNIWVELIRDKPKITFFVILVLLFLVIGQTAKAADIQRTVDPNQQATYTITCEHAATREDGSPYDPADYQTTEFHESTDGEVYTEIASELSCAHTLDVSSMPDGLYMYKASDTDVFNLKSILSTDRLLLTLRRVPTAAPNSPVNISGP